MRKMVPGMIYPVALGIVLCLISLSGAETVGTQTFTLHPGWNAIFLEVQPDPKDPASVFGGIAEIESVWTWTARTSPVQFISNPAEGLLDKSGWNAYFLLPSEAFLTNLFAIYANRPYLVKVNATGDKTLVVTGRPVLSPLKWVTSSFNLLGFRVDPDIAGPTFESFFAPSAAHRGQTVYRLDSSGVWEFTAPAERMRSGEAYWVYCSGASSYQGPLTVEVTANDLDFAKLIPTKILTVINQSNTEKTVSFQLQPLYSNVLVYKSINTLTQRLDWINLESRPADTIPAGGSLVVSIGARRENMSAPRIETVLKVSDNQGNRILVPAVVEK